jgi:AcrR family transcriptional regulator
MAETTYEIERGRIVQASEKVIHHFGFEKTTMNDIAKAIRKGKSSLYHYFTSKEQIFVAVLHKEVADLKDEFLKVIDSEPTPEGKIRAYILTRMQIFRSKLNRHMAFIEATAERYELLMRMHEEYDPEEIRIISAILQDGVERGAFAIDDIEATAAALVSALKSFEYPFDRAVDGTATEKTVDSMLKMLFYGIVPR